MGDRYNTHNYLTSLNRFSEELTVPQPLRTHCRVTQKWISH
jgi:hypothetical protein